MGWLKMGGCIVLLVILFIVPAHSENLITDRPSSAVKRTGHNVTFVCGVTFDESDPQLFTWIFIDQNSALHTLYDYTIGGNENPPHDPDKHEVETSDSQSILTVNDLAEEDAGFYSCKFLRDPPTDQASLVVISTLDALLYSPKEDIEEGDSFPAECKLGYAAPAPLGEDETPQLTAFLDTEELTPVDDNALSAASTITKTYNLTISREHHEKLFRCEMKVVTPPVTRIDSRQITVTWPVDGVQVERKQEAYSVGDNVTCVGDASPPADQVVWRRLNEPLEEYGDNPLVLLDEWIGENNWTCTLTNTINGKWHQSTGEFFFTLYEGATPTPPASTSSKDVAIAMGVVIPLILIAVAAGVAFYFLKIRKPSSKENQSNADQPSDLNNKSSKPAENKAFEAEKSGSKPELYANHDPHIDTRLAYPPEPEQVEPLPMGMVKYHNAFPPGGDPTYDVASPPPRPDDVTYAQMVKPNHPPPPTSQPPRDSAYGDDTVV